jgi:hypothetical protein
MKNSLIKAASGKLEAENIIYCLEFLSRDALQKDLPNIHNILQSSIAEIVKTNNPGNDCVDVDFSDILNAFKFFAKFCLIKDSNAKKQIIEMIKNVDKEALNTYANIIKEYH